MAGIRRRFALWLAAVAALAAVYAVFVNGRLQVETDLFAMLPTVERDPLVESAVKTLSATTGRRTLFLAGGSDEAQARATAEDLAAALTASGLFDPVTLHLPLDTGALDALYGPNRGVLLADAQRAALGEPGALAQAAQRALYSPAGWLRARPFAQDPLNLYGSFLAQQLPAVGNLRLSGDVLFAPSPKGPYAMLTAESRADPFSLSENARVEAAIAGAIAAAAQKHPGAEVLTSGVVRHAAAASARGQQELATFGSVSTLGIVLLIALVFRSARPLALTLLSLGVGALAALTFASLAFERVHLITLVFGSTLTGVGVDYSIHWFADQFRYEKAWDPQDTLHHVGPAIGIGMFATVLGYVALTLLPFPGLRQMALFSIVGIVAACATVLCAHPFLANRAPATHRPAALGFARWLGDLPMSGLARLPPLAFAALAALVVIGFWRLEFVDDIRALQSTPAWLKDQEARVRELLGGGLDTRFFLVEGSSAEELLQREEALRAGLDAQVAGGALAGYQAISRGLPSLARQQADRALAAQKLYSQDGELSRLLAARGYPRARDDEQHAGPGAGSPLTPAQWLASPVSAPLRGLWLESTAAALGRGFASCVTLSGVKDLAALQTLLLPGVTLVDRVASVSAILKRFRREASWGLVAAFAIVGGVLAWRYGLAVGLRLLVAPVGGAALTLAALGLLGVPVNLFNILALLLVLGMGVDYAVFMREGHAARTTVIMAILLAGLMTLLSFGLLAASTTPFIRALGLTVMLGVSFTFMLALVTTQPAPP